MSSKPHPHEPLIFAWGVRDHSTWHLLVSALLLIGAVACFSFVFRIVQPISQRLPATPQHVLSLDPRDPAALALIHRAQDRSFALLGDSDSPLPTEIPSLAFRPSFEGYQLTLREMAPATATTQPPRLFTAASGVLPPVPHRAMEPITAPPASTLRAIMSPALAKRGPASVAMPGINLTQPARVQFRVAIGAAGQIITALPLGSVEDKEVMSQLHAAVTLLRFKVSPKPRIEWGEISFRWEVAHPP